MRPYPRDGQHSLTTRKLVPISLCCFGRGGSSILWNMVGSSPAVVMMRHEWHEAVFSGFQGVNRAIRWANRRGLFRTVPSPAKAPLAQMAKRRVVADLRQDDFAAKTQAKAMAVKVMDYNIWHLPVIEQGFGATRPVVFARNPLAQCESLMRSGLTVEEAADWYRDVATAMLWVRDTYGASLFYFEDMVADPKSFAERLLRDLGLPMPKVYRLKQKRFGADRDPRHQVAVGKEVVVPASDLRDFIDPNVHDESIARLEAGERRIIIERTIEPARALGYFAQKHTISSMAS